MEIEDEFNISVNDVYITVEITARGGVVHTGETRPQWKGDYSSELEQWASALEKVRSALDEIDDDQDLPIGTEGMGVGEIYVEHDHEQEVLAVREDNREELVGGIPWEELREIAEQAGGTTETEN